MNKILVKLTFLMVLLVGCDKSDRDLKFPTESREVTISVTTIPEGNASDLQKWGLNWCVNHELGAWESVIGSQSSFSKFISKDDGGESESEFTGDVYGTKLRLVHPYLDSKSVEGGELEVSLENYSVDVTAPLSDLSKAMYMVSDEFDVKGDGSSLESVTMHHIGSVLDLKLDFDSVFGNSKVDLISLKIDGLPVRGILDLKSSVEPPYQDNCLTKVSSGSLEVELVNASGLDNLKSISVPLPIFSGEVSEFRATITCSINDKLYTLVSDFKPETPLKINSGCYYALSAKFTTQSTPVQFNLDGDGSEDSPYLIENSYDYNLFLRGLDSVTYYNTPNCYGAGLHFLQTKSFTAPDTESTSEGEYYTGGYFAGHYNGGGNMIYYTHNGSLAAQNGYGLFAELRDGAVVEDLILNATLSGVGRNAGILAGASSGRVELKGIKVSGSVNDCGENIGGLVGYATGELKVTNSRCFATIEGNNNIGGLAGKVENCKLSVDDFSNIGVDKQTGKDAPQLMKVWASGTAVGGLVGYIKGVNESTTCQIKDVTIQNSITSIDKGAKLIYGKSMVGGLFGYLSMTSKVELESVSIQTPVTAESDCGGGLIGCLLTQQQIYLNDCQFASYLSGGDNLGGFFGKVEYPTQIEFEGNKLEKNSVESVGNGYIGISGNDKIGGLIGLADVTLIRFNSKALVNVNVYGNSYVGGAFGWTNSDNTIRFGNLNIDTNMTVNGDKAVGGFIGYLKHGNLDGEGVDLKSYSFDRELPSMKAFTPNFLGTVKGLSEGSGDNLGGIVGEVASDAQSSIVNMCFGGTVSGHTNVGGLVGYACNGFTISSCVSRGALVQATDHTAGGVVGRLNYPDKNSTHLINYTKVLASGTAGGVIGYIYLDPSFSLEWSFNDGEVTATGGELFDAGGVVGYALNTSHENKYLFQNLGNYGTVTSSNKMSSLGGIAGSLNGRHIQIYSSINHGKIVGLGECAYVGGVVGKIGDEGGILINENYDIAYCCNTGQISSTYYGAYVGGVVGLTNEGSNLDGTDSWCVHDCYNSGEIASDHDENTGGIVGHIRDNVHVRNSINTGLVRYGNGCVGDHLALAAWYADNLYYLKGSGGDWKSASFEESDKKKSSTFKDFDFNSVWAIDNDDTRNSGYPYLRSCPLQNKE